MSDKPSSHTWEEAVAWLRQQPEQQELVRDCYYDDPLLEAAERYYQSEEWRAIRALLSNHLRGKVLDLGAGRGISSYAFTKEGSHVIALEPDPSPLVGAEAIQNLIDEAKVQIDIVKMYGETLPFADNSFDVVFGRAVLHHAYDLNRLCKEVSRVLKPRGVFLAVREHVISRLEHLQAFLDSHALHHLYGGENAFLLSDYQQAILQSGLKLKTTLGPFDSVINYAPMSQTDLHSMLAMKLSQRMGMTLAQTLLSFPPFTNYYRHRFSEKSNIPGRLYAFLASK